ncbi:quercetin dioxygenase-like cupin family protein [Sinorhizobium fredii]
MRAPCVSTLPSRRPRRRGCAERRSPSNPAHVPPGTPHPLGQTLIVTSGRGLAQSWGGELREIRAGDVVWFPPGEKHWHGAAADTGMTHIAIQEAFDGKVVDWLEHVTDEQYRG